MEKFKTGSIRCFEVLYSRYAPAVLAFVSKLIKDQMRAEDITQNIFMKLYMSRNVIDPGISLKNWLFVCAKNAALDYLKSKWSKDVISTGPPDEYIQTSSAEDEIMKRDLARRLIQMMDDLPDRRSKILKMSKIDAMKNNEIAEMLGISVRTVEKHLELAMRDLRKKFN